MEIERKFLLKEKNKIYASPFDTGKLKKKIIEKGLEISQNYLPKKIIPLIKKELNFNFNFKPNELRLRKMGNKYFLTIKSKGIMKREEFEIKISKKIYDKYLPLKNKSLKKFRLKKKYKNQLIEFDYFPKYELLTFEIEFESLKNAKEFKINAKEITKIKKYRNRYLSN